MAKKLNIKDVQKESKKLNEKTRLVLDDKYYIDIDSIFKESKINDLFIELAETMKIAKDENIDFEQISIFDWIVFYSMKYFTTLGDLFSDDIEEQIRLFTILVDLGYYKKIAENLNQAELQKIFNKADDVNKAFDITNNYFSNLKNEVKQLDLENKDVFVNE